MKTLRILIVEARFYDHIADLLMEGAREVLERAGAEIETISVPGALEIPGVIAMAADLTRRFDGYVALGTVIRGETYHFEVVSNESARGLNDLAITRGLAIGNGVLTTEDEAQALTRARPSEGDKGGGAAHACLSMIRVRRGFEAPA